MADRTVKVTRKADGTMIREKNVGGPKGTKNVRVTVKPPSTVRTAKKPKPSGPGPNQRRAV